MIITLFIHIVTQIQTHTMSLPLVTRSGGTNVGAIDDRVPEGFSDVVSSTSFSTVENTGLYLDMWVVTADRSDVLTSVKGIVVTTADDLISGTVF